MNWQKTYLFKKTEGQQALTKLWDALYNNYIEAFEYKNNSCMHKKNALSANIEVTLCTAFTL